MFKKEGVVPLISLFIAAFIWGSTFLFLNDLINYFSVSFIVFFRFLIASICVVILFRKKIKNPPNQLIYFYSLAMFLGFFLQTYSLKYMFIAQSAFLSSLFVLMIPLVKVFILKKPISKMFYGVLGVLVIGLYFLTRGFTLDFSLDLELGDFIALISAISFTCSILTLEKVSETHNDYEITLYSFITITIIALLYFVVHGVIHNNIIEDFKLLGNMQYSIKFLVLGSIATVIPLYLMAKGQQYVPSQVASVIYCLEPVFASILSFCLVLEPVTTSKLIGIVIIFIALASSTFFNKKEEQEVLSA